FGPVLSVLKVRDLDEALEVANGTDYALTGGFFSRSPANIERIKAQLEAGNVYINRSCTGAIVGRHPFGGFKMSGSGPKAGGEDYLLNFRVPRVVTENTTRHGFAPEEAPEDREEFLPRQQYARRAPRSWPADRMQRSCRQALRTTFAQQLYHRDNHVQHRPRGRQNNRCKRRHFLRSFARGFDTVFASQVVKITELRSFLSIVRREIPTA